VLGDRYGYRHERGIRFTGACHGRFALLSFLNKRKRDRSLTGLSFGAQGVSLACVSRGAGDVPRLTAIAQRATNAEDPWSSLSRLADEHKLGRCQASALVAAGQYHLMLVEAPDVPPEELRAAIRWRIKDLLNFHVDDATIDVFEIPDQKSQSGRLMYAVAAKTPRIKEMIKGAEQTGLRLRVIDLPEMAIRNVAGLIDGDERGIASLYLGVDRGLIVISRRGTLFLARNVEVGEDQLAAASEDERLLLMETIALELQRSMDYYDSHFQQPPVGSIALMPTAVDMPFLVQHLESSLGINIQSVDLNELMDCPQPVEQALQARCLLAVGAALRRETVAL
jgi:MSHA biogenesis protein MshI